MSDPMTPIAQGETGVTVRYWAAARAAAGEIRMSIGETVPLDTATALITDLEKGRKINGKGLIFMTPGT